MDGILPSLVFGPASVAAEEVERRVAAAARIQSVHRGRQARRELQEKKSAKEKKERDIEEKMHNCPYCSKNVDTLIDGACRDCYEQSFWG